MSLAQELLAEAAKTSKLPEKSWLAKLSKEHRDAVEEARSSWRGMAGNSGISATKLAEAIRERMAGFGYKLPTTKVVQRWLTLGN